MSATRTLIRLLCALVVFGATPALAQRVITMNSDRCGADIAALASLTGSDIRPSAALRLFAGKCEAQNVRLTSKRAGITLEIDRLQWGRGSLTPFAGQLLPPVLALTATGITIVQAPKNDPVWSYLQRESRLSGGIDASLGFSFSAENASLQLTGAALDFANSDRLTLSARLRGVAPNLPAKPDIALLAIIADEIQLQLQGSSRFASRALSDIAARLDPGPGKMNTLKSSASTYLAGQLAPLLGPRDISSLETLIADFPRPAGTVSLTLGAAQGFSLIRLLALANGADPATALAGVNLSLRYQSAPGGATD